MTDDSTQNQTDPKTIKITTPGADAPEPTAQPEPATPQDASAQTEAVGNTHDINEATHRNAYAAKASSVYRQNVNNQNTPHTAAEATTEATTEATGTNSETETAPSPEQNDIWDTMDSTPLNLDPATAAQDATALAAQVAELKDQLARAVAEQENVRKRLSKEVEDVRKFAASKFANDMLSVADNLRRAIESVSAESRDMEAVKNLLEGVELTEKDLLAAFERHKLVQVDPTGEKFNPNLHEAMFEVPTTETEPGTVIQVIQPGYMIADRLLRPARVGVAKAP